jgi:hypothetical protein
MKIKDALNKIWNSQAFDDIADISYGVLECLGEVLSELFNHEKSISNDNSSNKTYNYWINLDYKEQFDYFSNNEYLKDYMANDYYSCDRHLTAMHVQHIADVLNRDFVDKYNRY